MDSLSYFKISKLETIVQESMKGVPIYIGFDMENGGVTELLVIPLTQKRLLLGRRLHGAIIIASMDDLSHIYNTPGGENDLQTTKETRKTHCFQNAPLELESNYFDLQLHALIAEKAQIDEAVIEYSVSNKDKIHHVVINKQWKVGNIIGGDKIDDFIVWRKCAGFSAAVIGVGCWTWENKASNDYIYEKMSLYHMEHSGAGLNEMKNLIKTFRAFCPILGKEDD